MNAICFAFALILLYNFYYYLNTEKTSDWWKPLCSEEDFDNIECSGKLKLLFSILEECIACGDKLLVFSQSLRTLNVIEKFLALITENTKNSNPNAQLGGFEGQWEKGVNYFRLDGSTNIRTRESYCRTFNDEKNTKARSV